MLGITPISRQRLFAMMAEAGRGAIPKDPLEEETPPAPGQSPIGLLGKTGPSTVQ